MEICSNLYRSLEELKVYMDKYKLIKLMVNRTSVINISKDGSSDGIIEMGSSKGVVVLEDKLRMLGLVGRISLCSGSPYQNMPVDLRLMSDNKEDSIICTMSEYPECCGAAIVKRFTLIQNQMSDEEMLTLFTKFIEIIYDLLGIIGYSNVSYVLSSRDNEVLYKGIDQIKASSSDANYTFLNKKTEALCTYLIKNV